MPSQPATTADLKAFFNEDLKPHLKRQADEFKRYFDQKVAELKTYVHQEIEASHDATADELAEVKTDLLTVNAKLDKLLTNTELYDVKRRLTIVEQALFSDHR
jgi:molecular chaperone GrpE (heat shock protein)